MSLLCLVPEYQNDELTEVEACYQIKCILIKVNFRTRGMRSLMSMKCHYQQPPLCRQITLCSDKLSELFDKVTYGEGVLLECYSKCFAATFEEKSLLCCFVR